jgi:ABC-2 type transport system ATP-binding protein
MSSHNLAEAQRICDRVGIIKHGKLIHEQAIGGDTSLSKTTFRVALAKLSDIATLQKTQHLTMVSHDGTTVLLQPKGSLAQALAALSKFDIREFATEQLNLEDEFIEFYGDNR